MTVEGSVCPVTRRPGGRSARVCRTADYIDIAPSRSMIRAQVSDASRSAAIGEVAGRLWTTRLYLIEAVIDIGLDGARRPTSTRQSA